MPRRKPLNKQFKLPVTRGDRTPHNRLGQIAHQTYEEEKSYLISRPCYMNRSRGYLPSPEEIEEAKAIIREENYERERLNREEGRFESRTPYYRTYSLDTSGLGARRGKLI